MKGPSIYSCSEVELVRQLKRLLTEEQRWLSQESSGLSPYLDRRAMILEALSIASRDRESGYGNYSRAEMDELRRQVMDLHAIHRQSIEMVRSRIKGLERAQERLKQDKNRVFFAPAHAHIGRG